MGDYIQRPTYLKKLIERKDNGSVKVVTGPRRCGKSLLLKRIYKDWLLSQGIPESDIIIISFDIDDDTNQSVLSERNELKAVDFQP